ncbi:HEXXH motif domain-containing protein [Amycolatopsis mediterranei]|uniref:HEXXH motif domain-containing protein n=1 Tax=Amycolatopsis mediterranei TaxID=33910 RepID=UPI003438F102
MTEAVLSLDDVRDLGSGSDDPRLLALLRDGQWGGRILLIQRIVHAVDAVPGSAEPLRPLTEVWDELVAIHDAHPDVVRSVLLYPQVGRWIGALLRRLNAVPPVSVPPLWIEAGHLHCILAAVAVKAGLSLTIRVPVRERTVVLPGVGFVEVSSDSAQYAHMVVADDGTRVEADGAVVRIPRTSTDEASGWHPLTTLGETGMRVYLDSQDPFRAIVPAGYSRPALPAKEDIDHWQDLLGGAWTVLTRADPAQAAGIAHTISAVVPWFEREESGYTSATSEESFGSIMLSRPVDPQLLAADLVHEYHHTKLSGLLTLLDLLSEDRGAVFYTAWRNEPRPIHGVLHGVFAFFGVTGFWRRQANTARGQFEFAYWRRQTWDVLDKLRVRPELTPVGRVFVDAMGDSMGPWLDEAVPEAVETLARDAILEHRAAWRLAHVRPPDDFVWSLADAWIRGHEQPTFVESGYRIQSRDVVRSRYAALVRSFLADATVSSSGLRTNVNEAHVRSVDDRDVVGIGLIARHLGHHSAARALLHYPDVVQAASDLIQARTGQAPPMTEFVRWISPPARPDLLPIYVTESDPAIP